jgi:MFS family permease
MRNGGERERFYLYSARAARGFGDGFAAVVLPAYLAEIGFAPFQIGLLATAALLGSAVLTLAIGFLGPRYALRSLLIACAILMILTGLAFPNFRHFAFLALIAFVGTINPSTGDIGVHVPLEHASLAHAASDQERTRTFARYSLIGALSIAAGALIAGVPDLLVSLGIRKLIAMQLLFYLYAALGLLAVFFYSRLSRAKPEQIAEKPAALGASRAIVYRLAALFSLDAFAGGFTVQSLLALWLFERFDLSLAAASVFFFWANVLSAFSYPVAARLLCNKPAAGARSAAGQVGVVANGCADPDLLCDGGGYPCGAHRSCERYGGSPQLGSFHQPRSYRGTAFDGIHRPAAGHLRHAQDCL